MPWLFWLWLLRQSTPRRTRDYYKCCIVAEFSGDGEPGMSGLFWELIREANRDE